MTMMQGQDNGNKSAGSARGEFKSLRIKDTALAYVERGAGQPVVFVHGALSDYRTWFPQVEALADRYHAISYSRRYHYPNAWSGDGSDYLRSSHVADLIAFLSALDVGPVHLVGHSYGGALAILLAQRRSDMVRSLVVGEPSLFSILDPDDTDAFSSQYRGFEEALRLVEAGQQAHGARAYLKIVVGTDVLHQLPPTSRRIVIDNARTLGPMLRSLFDDPPITPEEACGLKVPTLLVTGSHSPGLYRLITDRLHALLADAQLIVLEGASHGLQIERPADFNKALGDFLSSAATVEVKNENTSAKHTEGMS